MINENFFNPDNDCPACSTPTYRCNDWELIDAFFKDEKHKQDYILWVCSNCGHTVNVQWTLKITHEEWPDCECPDCEQNHRTKTKRAYVR